MVDKPPAKIVTTHYRYKPPPKRKQPVALEVPAVVRRGRKSGSLADLLRADEATGGSIQTAADAGYTVETPNTVSSGDTSAVVTAKRPKDTRTHHQPENEPDVDGSVATFLERMLADGREAHRRAQAIAAAMPPRRRIYGG